MTIDDNEEPALRRLLREANETVLHLLPREVREVIEAPYPGLETWSDIYRWESQAIQQVIRSAKPIECSSREFGPRAMCPLCGYGGANFYEDGYALPEGLARHLEGYGKTQQCRVMKAARWLVRDLFGAKARAAEYAEDERRKQEQESRSRRETLFQIHPDAPAELIDAGWGPKPVRDGSQLEWALQRLVSLGFCVTRDDNIITCTRDWGQGIAYADPRRQGAIEVRVFSKIKPRRKARVPLTRGMLHDRMKNDLKGRLAQVLGGTR